MMTPEYIRAQRDQQWLQDLRQLLGLPAFRRVAAVIVRDMGGREDGVGTGQGEPLFAGQVRDGVSAYGHQCFHAGRQDLAIDFERELKRADPAGWHLMRQEHDAEEVEAITLTTAQGEPTDD
jgi:hypothetical protein